MFPVRSVIPFGASSRTCFGIPSNTHYLLKKEFEVIWRRSRNKFGMTLKGFNYNNLNIEPLSGFWATRPTSPNFIGGHQHSIPSGLQGPCAEGFISR